MEIFAEIIKFFVSVGTILPAIFFAGFIYGLNRKIGLILMILGSITVIGLVSYAVTVIEWSSVSLNIGSFFGGVFSGLSATTIWNIGKSFSEKVRQK